MDAATSSDGWLWLGAGALVMAVMAAVFVLMPGAARAGAGYRRHFSGRVGHGLQDLLLFVDVDRLFRANLLVCLLACALAWLLTGSLLLVLVSAAVVGALPGVLIARLGRRRREVFARQLPDAMMLIAGAVRAGASMTLALRQMASELPAPGGQEFELMLRELRLGVTLDDALLNLERRMGCDDLRLFGAAVRIANESGAEIDPMQCVRSRVVIPIPQVFHLNACGLVCRQSLQIIPCSGRTGAIQVERAIYLIGCGKPKITGMEGISQISERAEDFHAQQGDKEQVCHGIHASPNLENFDQ